MKKSIIQKVHEAIQEESANADTMFVAHESNDDISVSLRGDSNKIGQALYAAMHDIDNPELAKDIYLMIKNITYNIINNPSDMADDMIAMFSQTTNEDVNKAKNKMLTLIKTGEA